MIAHSHLMHYLRAHSHSYCVSQQIHSLQHEGTGISTELHILGIGPCEVGCQGP